MAKIKVAYTSSWEEGNVETSAILDTDTGVVSDIETSDEGVHYQSLNYEFISYGTYNAFVSNLNPNNEFRVEEKTELDAIVKHYQLTISQEGKE